MAVATQPEPPSDPVLATVEVEKPINSGILSYPFDMDEKQDRIRFAAAELKKTDITNIKKGTAALQIKNPLPSTEVAEAVYLPIQSGISDTNAVEWGGAELNSIQRYLANASLNFMQKGATGINNEIEALYKALYKGDYAIGGLVGAGQLALAEQAVGVQGLLSRVTGSVLNPNLELLFKGPTLRPFQFQFKLSPRSKKEADRVKQIIKYFKKYMAVRATSQVFLKSPYVFNIQYQHSLSGAGVPHDSIGQIKACALQVFNVDYTPLGSYMTFDDDEATMVSYNISMQFQEIVPITSDDYDPKKPHPIGY